MTGSSPYPCAATGDDHVVVQVDLAGDHHPLGGFRGRYVRFWWITRDSAALLIEQGGEPDPGPGSAAEARLTAAVALAAYRSVYVASAARILAGDDEADVTADHTAAVNRAFDIVENGLPSGRS